MRFAATTWRLLTRALDAFGERARDREERLLLSSLRAAKQREAALEAAAAGDAKVDEELAKTRAEIAELRERLPRGHTPAFLLLCFACAATIPALIMLYADMGDGIVEMWGTLDNLYLLRYRRTATLLFGAGRVLTSPLWTGIGLVALLGTLWYLQRRLERRHARTLLRLAAVVEILFVVTLWGALCRLSQLPLV